MAILNLENLVATAKVVEKMESTSQKTSNFMSVSPSLLREGDLFMPPEVRTWQQYVLKWCSMMG